MDIKRLKELAGLENRNDSINDNSLSENELLTIKNDLENKIASTFFLNENIAFLKTKLARINRLIEANAVTEELKQVDGKWALVSKKTGKPLRYYKGEGKPSQEWVSKQEKSIQYFKHLHEDNISSEENNETRNFSEIYDHFTSLHEDTDFEDSEINEDTEHANALITKAYKKFKNDKFEKNTTMADVDKTDELFNKNYVDTVTDEDTERLGIAQDENTPVDVPAKIFSQIDNRIKELENSMEQFDKTTFQNQWNYKQNAIDALNFIKEKLAQKNLLGFKQAIIHYNEYASFISELFPAALVNFLHTGMEQKNEIPTTSLKADDPDKLHLNDVPYNNVKPRDSVIYPQISKSKI